MPPLISIVVPVYKTGERIRSTIQSIADQSYRNLELILVDDASPDDSINIAKKVLESGSIRWKIVRHEANQGVSAARNTGLAHARGGYVCFVDNDDLLKPDYAAILYETIAKDDSDAAFCSCVFRHEKTGEEKEIRPAIDEKNNNCNPEFFLLAYLSRKLSVGCWSFLFKTDFIKSANLQFTPGCVAGEDGEFIIKALARSKKTVFVDNVLYIYQVHDDMTSKTFAASYDNILSSLSSNIQAQIRSANYLIEHAKSPKAISLAKYWMLPKMQLKQLNIYAWEKNRLKFDAISRDSEVRSLLFSSYKAFFKEPQLFLKVLALFFFPAQYYRYRENHIYGYRI
jgi:glycosyltransferase involved in cell wall biosynthesis